MSDLAKHLTSAEAEILAQCEETISHGLQTFIDVGTSLALIRDNRLYRAEDQTFDVYCARRWGFTDRRARQIIEAAEIGRILPVANAAQASELARVPEEQRAEIWAKANESTGGKPTAAAIREAFQPSRPETPARWDPEQLPPEAPAVATTGGPAQDRPSATAEEADGQPASPGPATGPREADGVAPPEAAGSSVEDSGEPSVDGEEELRVPALQPDSSDAAGAPAHFPAASAPDPTDLVTKVLDALVPDDNPHREWQRRFLSDIGSVHRLMRNDVEDVAEKADSQCIEELGRIFSQLDEYRSKVLAALKASTPDNVTPLRRTS